MAVIEGLGELIMTAAGGSRRWVLSVGVPFTRAAGSSFDLLYESTSTGLTPPQQADTVTITLRDVAEGTIRSYTVTPAGPNSTTFWLRVGGVSGGAIRAGTVLMDIRVTKTTGGPTATYDVGTAPSDPNTPIAGGSTSTRDRGYVRGSTTSTQTVSNVALGGAKNLPFELQESIFIQTTYGASPFANASVTHTTSQGGIASGQTWVAGSTQTNSTTSSVVDKRFPVGLTSGITTGLTVANASQTGQPQVPVTNTPDTFSTNPNGILDHLLMLNQAAYLTPPMSANSASGEVGGGDTGYLATHLRKARTGAVVGNARQGGHNGLFLSFELRSDVDTNTVVNQPMEATATRGGEAGWMPATPMPWTATKPGGRWTKTVSMGTTDVITNAYLTNRTIQYTLLAARNPNLQMFVFLGTPSRDDHFLAGADLEIEAGIVNTQLRTSVAVDAPGGVPAAGFVLRRINNGNLQHLDAGLNWVNSHDGSGNPVASYLHPMAKVANQNLYRAVIPGSVTAGWGNDVEAIIRLEIAGVAYTEAAYREMTGAKNPHSRNTFDPTGLFA